MYRLPHSVSIHGRYDRKQHSKQARPARPAGADGGRGGTHQCNYDIMEGSVAASPRNLGERPLTTVCNSHHMCATASVCKHDMRKEVQRASHGNSRCMQRRSSRTAGPCMDGSDHFMGVSMTCRAAGAGAVPVAAQGRRKEGP